MQKYINIMIPILVFLCLCVSSNAQGTAQGPPQKIEVDGYPMTATQNPSGGVTLDHCGADMNKLCYIRYKYPTIMEGSDIGSDIDIYYGDLDNGTGFINAELTTEIEDDYDALPFNYEENQETQTFTNYSNWYDAICEKYEIEN
jgi:hypothetical protein